MELNARVKGRGRRNKGNFQGKGRWGGMMAQGPMYRPGPPGMYGPPVGFPTELASGGPSFYGEPSGFNYGSLRPTFGNYFRKNFKKKITQKSIEIPVPEIDLTKPWVTEELKNEENKKQVLLKNWRRTKTEEDWSKYKMQKLTLQTLYDKAKTEYAESHPEEAIHWESIAAYKYSYCEMCDKSFRTDDDLILHEAEHEVCGRDNCEFTAHPKIIAKHIKMQHMTGLYKRIGKLYTEEDIAKWIEERKRRYPTRKVVEEKKILEQEKLNRGEKIKDKDSKFNKSFHNKSNSKGSRRNLKKKKNKSLINRRVKKKKKPCLALRSLAKEEISDFRKGVPAFLGIKNCDEVEMPKKKYFDISDEEWDTESKPPNTAKPLLNSSLKLLATFYNSDEEIRNEEYNKEAELVFSGDEGRSPEEVKTVICKNPLPEEKSHGNNICKRKFQGTKYNEERKRNVFSSGEIRSLTLLEKLLRKEIRHERNVILQCIHYVIQNNFLKT